MTKIKSRQHTVPIGGVAHGDAIVAITPLEILDSRGNPTLQVMVELLDGSRGVARVPSGASTGRHEAVEWRDGDKGRFAGKGLLGGLARIKGEISDVLIGQRACDQQRLDGLMVELDGSDNKKILGANSILATSMAVAAAAANHCRQSVYRYMGGAMANMLPVPMMNIINGGVHANNNLTIQEFMVMPINFSSFPDALRAGVEIFHSLKAVLNKKGLSTAVGDEGGFAPSLAGAEEALMLIGQATEMAGYKIGKDIFYALDCASTEFFKDGVYHVGKEKLKAPAWADMLAGLCKKFPIWSVEDGMAEDDMDGWHILTDKLGKMVQLVGDDLFVTNQKRLQMGIDNKLGNAMLVKPNQIGTLTETMAAVEMAKRHGYRTIMSHRSGETEDSMIADLAVAWATGQIKTGAPSRSDRTAKYNRLLTIHDELGHEAIYGGVLLKK